MKKQTPFPTRPARSLALALLLIASACGSKDTAVPVADNVKKVWAAQTVQENSTLVFTRGAVGNSRNYASYRLDLSNPPSASLTDLDGVPLSGQYELPSDTRLILKNLNPQPSGTNGTIEFTINSVSNSQLNLTRTTTSQKTGGTTNQYLLTNP